VVNGVHIGQLTIEILESGFCQIDSDCLHPGTAKSRLSGFRPTRCNHLTIPIGNRLDQVCSYKTTRTGYQNIFAGFHFVTVVIERASPRKPFGSTRFAKKDLKSAQIR
jgi:hypothetical protein